MLTKLCFEFTNLPTFNDADKPGFVGMMISFDELFEDQTRFGTKLKTDEYQETGKNIIVDQGQNDIAGYTDKEDGIYNDVPALIFGDHTRIVKYIDKPFFLGADGTKILKSRKEDANYKYLFYALKSANIPNTGYNRHFKWLKELNFEYPGISKQEKIANILFEIENIIDNQNKELQLLDELIKARFVSFFNSFLCLLSK